jgi:tetratricopeptide (TPR) repeat protein
MSWVADFDAGGWAAVSPALDAHLAARGIPAGAVRAAGARALLASALRAAGRPAAALPLLEQALGHTPGDPELWAALAQTFQQVGQHAAATLGYAQAEALAPADARFSAALGEAHLRADAPEAALAPLERAVRLDPGLASAWKNLGVALRALGRAAEALAADETAVACAPGDAEARWNRGMSRLTLGQWASGWADYEARRELADVARPPLPPLPAWGGGPVGRLVVHAEQGLGDALQFARYLVAARAQAQHLTLLGPAALAPLLGRHPGVDRYVSDATAADGDALAPLLSLPHLLSCPDPRDAPPCGIAALPARLDRWRPAVRALGRRVIGVAWQGNPAYAADRRRSPPLAALTPLLADPRYTWLSLQKVHGLDQLAALPPALRPVDWRDRLDVDGAAFEDTAAVLGCLDALVCSDTAVAHLAGALGVRTALLLCASPDWRWGLTGDRSPFYATLRLCRQRVAGDWTHAVAAAAALLEEDE